VSTLTGKDLAVDLKDIDVVVSGGGNYDAFYMGVHMVLDRLSDKLGDDPRISRYGGVSAGGMMPFEIKLKGTEDKTEISPVVRCADPAVSRLLLQLPRSQLPRGPQLASNGSLADGNLRLNPLLFA